MFFFHDSLIFIMLYVVIVLYFYVKKKQIKKVNNLKVCQSGYSVASLSPRLAVRLGCLTTHQVAFITY